MLVSLVLVLIATGGVAADGCQTRFVACLGPMQSVMSAGPGGNMAEACGVINEALHCIDEVVESCPNNPTLQTMVEGMQLDNMRTMCAMYRGGDDSGCPPDYLQQMQTCMTDIAIGSSSTGQTACTKLTSGLECLESVYGRCPSNRELQGLLTTHINMSEVRANQTAACTPPEEPESTCNVPQPARALKKCQNKMISSSVTRRKKAKARCRSVLKGFKCLRNLLNRCPNDPLITSFTSLEYLDRQQPSLVRMCQRLDRGPAA